MKNQNRPNAAIRTTPFYWISKSFLRNLKPSWRAILAYNALAYYAHGESGTCENFSVKTLARLVGTSKDSILRGLDELEQKGAITRKRRSRKVGEKRMALPTLYELALLDDSAGEPI